MFLIKAGIKCAGVMGGEISQIIAVVGIPVVLKEVDAKFVEVVFQFFFFSSRRRHTRWNCDWSSDVCSSDLEDCCTLEEAVGPTGGPLVLGVLDIVADHALDVTVTHTANGAGRAATSIDARTITPRRA